jgi:hypothetical protein
MLEKEGDEVVNVVVVDVVAAVVVVVASSCSVSLAVKLL